MLKEFEYRAIQCDHDGANRRVLVQAQTLAADINELRMRDPEEIEIKPAYSLFDAITMADADVRHGYPETVFVLEAREVKESRRGPWRELWRLEASEYFAQLDME